MMQIESVHIEKMGESMGLLDCLGLALAPRSLFHRRHSFLANNKGVDAVELLTCRDGLLQYLGKLKCCVGIHFG